MAKRTLDHCPRYIEGVRALNASTASLIAALPAENKKEPTMQNPTRRSAPINMSAYQLQFIRSLVRKQEEEEEKVLQKLRDQEEELARLTSTIMELVDKLAASSIIRDALVNIPAQFAVLGSASSTTKESVLSQFPVDTQLDDGDLEGLTIKTRQLQEELKRFGTQKLAKLTNQLSTARSIHPILTEQLNSTKAIASILNSSIQTYRHGVLNIVNRLPRDILHHIFDFLELERSMSWQNQQSSREWAFFPVAQVCWYWRDVAANHRGSFYAEDREDTADVNRLLNDLSRRGHKRSLKPSNRLYLKTKNEQCNVFGVLRDSALSRFWSGIPHLRQLSIRFDSHLFTNLPEALSVHLSTDIYSDAQIPARLLKQARFLECSDLWPVVVDQVSNLQSLVIRHRNGPIINVRSVLELLGKFPGLKKFRLQNFTQQVRRMPNQLAVQFNSIEALQIPLNFIPEVNRLLTENLLRLPALTRLELHLSSFIGLTQQTALFRQITHLDLYLSKRRPAVELIRSVLPAFKQLVTLEIHGEDALFILAALYQPNIVLPYFKDLIICNWQGNGDPIHDYVVARQTKVEKENKLRMVRFENCPNVEAPMRARIQAHCDCIWDPSCVEMDGWTTR